MVGQAPAFCIATIMARAFARQFYSSKAWRDCREAYWKKAHGLCEECLKRGAYKPGEIVHHIIELTPDNITDPRIATGFDNLQLVCRECHAAKHEDAGWSKVNEARRKKKECGTRYFIDENGKVSTK